MDANDHGWTDGQEESGQINRRRLFTAAARAGAGIALGSTALVPALAGGTRAGNDRAPIQLSYWTHNFTPANTLNKRLIADYMRRHPNVHITWDNSPHASFEPKLLTAFAGGGGPDAYWCGDWLMPQFIPGNLVAPFDPQSYGVASQQAFINHYDPHTFDAFMSGGKLYTGGISEYNTFSLVYNKALFRAAGISYPSATEPMTWEQTAAIAQKLTRFSGGKRVRSGWEFVYNVPIWAVLQVEPMVRQLGGELVNPSTGQPQFDSAPVIQTMQFFHDLRVKYKANDPAFPNTTDSNLDVAQGRIAMFIEGIWAIAAIVGYNPAIKNDLGVAPLPTWTRGGKRVTCKYAWAWQVNPRTTPAKQQAAWQFLSFLTSQANAWYNVCGYVEPLRNHWPYMTSKQPLLKIFREDFAYGQYEFRSRHYLELSQVLNRAFQQIQSGDNPSTVMKKAQQEALRAAR